MGTPLTKKMLADPDCVALMTLLNGGFDFVEVRWTGKPQSGIARYKSQILGIVLRVYAGDRVAMFAVKERNYFSSLYGVPERVIVPDSASSRVSSRKDGRGWYLTYAETYQMLIDRIILGGNPHESETQ